MREKYREEMYKSLLAGGLITLFIFAFVHQIFTTGEVIAFWLGTQMIATYCVWSVIIWAERGRDAWGSNHGKN